MIDKQRHCALAVAIVRDYLKLQFALAIQFLRQRVERTASQIVAIYSLDHLVQSIVFVDYPMRIYRAAFERRTQNGKVRDYLIYRFAQILQVDLSVVIYGAVYHSVIIISKNVLNLVPKFCFKFFHKIPLL
jgi:hypothetical protein